MTAYVKVNGAYQDIPNGDLFVKVGGSYQNVKNGYVKVGGSYQKFHTGSNPVTYRFVANQTKGARGYSWKTSSNVGGLTWPQIGKYINGVYPWYGLISFLNDTSGVSLNTRMNERPIVKSAYFNIQRESQNVHGYLHGSGTIYVGRYNGYITDATPAYTKCDFNPLASKTFSGSGSAVNQSYTDNFLSRGEFIVNPGTYTSSVANGGLELGSNRQTFIEHIRTANRPLCIAGVTSHSTSSSGLGHTGSVTVAQQKNFWNFWYAGKTGFGVHLGPTLTITLDYV